MGKLKKFFEKVGNIFTILEQIKPQLIQIYELCYAVYVQVFKKPIK